jgi:hypothetical protein
MAQQAEFEHPSGAACCQVGLVCGHAIPFLPEA